MKKLLLIIGIVIVVIAGALFLHTKNKPTVTTAPVLTKTYVALGDSIAAGVGLKPDSDSSACNRTDAAYPQLAATNLAYKLHNLACSGATLPAGILGKQDVNQLLVAAQLDQLFSLSKPNLISLTIGANDTDWTTLLSKCYTGTCGSDSDTAAYTKNLAGIADNLLQSLSLIQTHYKNAVPPVIITGYHQVFPNVATNGCTDLAGIDASELSWGRGRQTALNDTIRQVSQEPAFASFASFVPVDFSGHELCSADPWVQGLGDSQPYHPTAAGQTAFAKQVVAAARNTK